MQRARDAVGLVQAECLAEADVTVSVCASSADAGTSSSENTSWSSSCPVAEVLCSTSEGDALEDSSGDAVCDLTLCAGEVVASTADDRRAIVLGDVASDGSASGSDGCAWCSQGQG